MNTQDVNNRFTGISDEELIILVQQKVKRKNVIHLNDYFNNPEIDPYFEEIYNRYRRRIEYYCTRFIFDRDVIPDIFHDIFIKVILNIAKFKKKNSFKAWIYAIAHNTCANYIRNNKNLALSLLNRRLSAENEKSNELIDLFCSPEPGVENKIINREINEAVEYAVAKLPVQLINVFLLKSKANLTFDEIARIEKKSSRNIKTLYQNALQFIKNELSNKNLSLQDMKEI